MRDLLQRPDLFSINTATLGYKTPLPAIIDAWRRTRYWRDCPLAQGVAE